MRRILIVLVLVLSTLGIAAPAHAATGWCGFPTCPVDDVLYTATWLDFASAPTLCGRQGALLDTTWGWSQGYTSVWNGYLCTDYPTMPANTFNVKTWYQCGDANKYVIASFATPRVYNLANQTIVWSPHAGLGCPANTAYVRTKVSSCFYIYPTGWKCYALWISWKAGWI